MSPHNVSNYLFYSDVKGLLKFTSWDITLPWTTYSIMGVAIATHYMHSSHSKMR